MEDLESLLTKCHQEQYRANDLINEYYESLDFTDVNTCRLLQYTLFKIVELNKTIEKLTEKNIKTKKKLDVAKETVQSIIDQTDRILNNNIMT